MIRLATGPEIRRFCRRGLAAPESLEQLVVCSPFLDPAMTAELVALASATRHAQCGFRVLTRPANAEGLLRQLPGHPARWRSTVLPVQDLHAKAYLAIARHAPATRAIITSANLTNAGAGENLELGIIAAPTSDAGRRIITELRDFFGRLMDVPRRSLPINDPRRAA